MYQSSKAGLSYLNLFNELHSSDHAVSKHNHSSSKTSLKSFFSKTSLQANSGSDFSPPRQDPSYGKKDNLFRRISRSFSSTSLVSMESSSASIKSGSSIRTLKHRLSSMSLVSTKKSVNPFTQKLNGPNPRNEMYDLGNKSISSIRSVAQFRDNVHHTGGGVRIELLKSIEDTIARGGAVDDPDYTDFKKTYLM